MAVQPQIIVQPAVPSNKPMGTRNDQNIRASFASSPLYNGTMSDQERKKLFQELALDGDVASQGGSLSGPGYGLNNFSRDYIGSTQNPVPDLEDVESGGGGLPASPYIPNLTSPGPGSINASDQPIYNGTLPDSDNNIEFGSGLGGLASPAETSQRIAQQTLLGSYISGRSYLGSDGSS